MKIEPKKPINENSTPPPPEGPENLEDRIATWADLEKELGPIEFDWEPWLPVGLLSMVASYSGDGKSALMLRIAGCYTDGLDWPDGTKFTGERGKVLWCEAESGQAVNLDRAKKWGLSIENFITPFSDPAADVSLDNPSHIAAITAKAYRPDVKLIVIDSLSGASNKKENETQIKQVTESLARMTRDVKKVSLLSHHLNKKGMTDSDVISLERVRGSSAIVQFTRVVWAIDKPDRLYPNTNRLSMIKNNIARFVDPIGFTMFDNGIKFVDPPSAPRIESQTDKAGDMLMAILSKQPVKATEIQEKIEAESISWRTANIAKKRLNLISVKRDGIWYWSLPAYEKTLI